MCKVLETKEYIDWFNKQTTKEKSQVHFKKAHRGEIKMTTKKFNIDSLKPVKIKSNKTLFKNNSIEFFKNNRLVARALSDAILEGDKEGLS